MTRGMLGKIWLEVGRLTLLFSLALFAAEALMVQVLPQLGGPLAEIWLEVPFIKAILTTMFGIGADEDLTIEMMQTFLWVHPVVLTLVWGTAITLATRYPAGEVDRGTIDVLLGWPVSRLRVYACEGLVWFTSGLAIISLGFLGYWISSRFLAPDVRPDVSRLGGVILNLFASYVAVAGLSCLSSSLHDVRARAVAWSAGFILASFLLGFLAQFWAPAEAVAFLSISTYYQPTMVALRGGIPTADILILFGVAAVSWAAGAIIVSRRNLCTT